LLLAAGDAIVESKAAAVNDGGVAAAAASRLVASPAELLERTLANYESMIARTEPAAAADSAQAPTSRLGLPRGPTLDTSAGSSAPGMGASGAQLQESSPMAGTERVRRDSMHGTKKVAVARELHRWAAGAQGTDGNGESDDDDDDGNHGGNASAPPPALPPPVAVVAAGHQPMPAVAPEPVSTVVPVAGGSNGDAGAAAPAPAPPPPPTAIPVAAGVAAEIAAEPLATASPQDSTDAAEIPTSVEDDALGIGTAVVETEQQQQQQQQQQQGGAPEAVAGAVEPDQQQQQQAPISVPGAVPTAKGRGGGRGGQGKGRGRGKGKKRRGKGR